MTPGSVCLRRNCVPGASMWWPTNSRGHGRSGGWCKLGDLEHADVAATVDLANSRSPTHRSRECIDGSCGSTCLCLIRATTCGSCHRFLPIRLDIAPPNPVVGQSSPGLNQTRSEIRQSPNAYDELRPRRLRNLRRRPFEASRSAWSWYMANGTRSFRSAGLCSVLEGARQDQS